MQAVPEDAKRQKPAQEACVKRSIELSPGTYQWEWTDDAIAVAKWDKPPTSTLQWATVEARRFYFEGTSNDDIRVVIVLEKRRLT